MRGFANLLLIFFLFSCSSAPQTANSNFSKKYGKDVEKIRQERMPPIPLSSDQQEKSRQKTEVDWRDQLSNNGGENYAYMDSSQFNEKNPPQEFLPNAQVYQNAQNIRTLPDDMFIVTYNTDLYPPFVKYGVEFDNIEIPQKDSYGVETAMSNKVYMLAGNESLQKNIDKINEQRTLQDVKNSEILIAEQKRLRREQKSKEIFGSSQLNVKEKKEKPQPQILPKQEVKKEKAPVPVSVPVPVAEVKKEEKKSGLAGLIVKGAELDK